MVEGTSTTAHHFEYDEGGHQTLMRDVWTRGSDNYHDETTTLWLGRAVTVTHAWTQPVQGSQLQVLTVDSLGNVVSQVTGVHPTSTGGQTLSDAFEYDAAGRLVAAQPSGLGQPRTWDYGPDGRLSTETFGPETTQYLYEERGLLSHITAPAPSGLTWNTHRWYDARGLMTAEAFGDVSSLGSVSSAQITGFGYDDAGQLNSRTAGANSVTSQGSAVGGNAWTYTVGPRGELLQTVLPASLATWAYDYDALGRLAQVTPPIGGAAATQTFRFDALGRQTKRTRGSLEWNTTWDGSEGRETSSGLNNVRTVTLDGRGRVIRVRNVAGAGPLPLSGKDFLYDGLNAVTKLTETRTGGTVSQVFDYDDAHLLAKVTRTGEPDVVTNRNTDGQPSSLTVGADTITYGYDGLNRLRTVSGAWGSTDVHWQPGGGSLASVSDAVLSTAWCPDTQGQLQSVLTAQGGGVPACGATQGLLVGLQYRYDARGNRISETRVGSVGATRRFGYDAADRLVGAVEADGHSVLWDLTADGSRRAEKQYPTPVADPTDFSTPNPSKHTSFEYDSQGVLHFAYDELAAHATVGTYVVDGEGRTTSITRGGQTTTLVWDVEGRLVHSAMGGNSTDFDYDGFGLRRRAQTTAGGVATVRTWLWAGANGELPVGEAPAGGALQLKAFAGGMTLAQGTTRFGYDGLGSAVASRRGTLSPQVYGYDAYGGYSAAAGLSSAPATSEVSVGFTGHSFDADVGLTYAQQRWLDSTTGAWLSQDPVFGDLRNPNSLGPWAYANGNPLSFTDPTGEAVPDEGYTPIGYCLDAQNLRSFGGDRARCLAWASRELVTPGTAMKEKVERVDVSDVGGWYMPSFVLVAKTMAVYDEAQKANRSIPASIALAPVGAAGELTGTRGVLEWGHTQNLVTLEPLSEEEARYRGASGRDTMLFFVGAMGVGAGASTMLDVSAQQALWARKQYVLDNVLQSRAASASSGFGGFVLRENVLRAVNASRAASATSGFAAYAAAERSVLGGDASLSSREPLAGPGPGFAEMTKAEQQIPMTPQTLAEVEDALRLAAGQADLSAVGTPRTSGRFGTAAHNDFEATGRSLNASLTAAGSPYRVAMEEFRTTAGGVTGRRAKGSLGLDAVVYDLRVGQPVAGFDLKTGRPWSPTKLQEIQRRFGVAPTQIQTR
ncbi:MAG: hypothetical protein LUO89_03030 [Methanothrix sp.]|nr:hypothetical protein [Methanothrix sp.]